jgi:molybdopterin-containing oxidoreductase family membrane subunit
MATAATLGKQKGLPASGWVGVVLGVLWLAAWIYQLSAGLGVTGLEQQVVWGLYIAGFFTAAGLGVGLVGVSVIGGKLGFADVAGRVKLVVLALASFIAAGVLITMDVGSPLTLWRLVTAGRFGSMMTWDFWLLALTFILTLVLAYQKPTARPSGLAWVTLVVGIVLVAVEAWMLSSLAAHPFWAGGRTLVSFLVGAAIAGQGIALLIASHEAESKLRRGLKTMLWLNLILVVAEVLSGLIGGTPRAGEEALSVLGNGNFWLQLIVGLTAPLVLLSGRSAKLKTAGGLAAFGVLLEKLWYLPAGQEQPWLALPMGSYWPSVIEMIAVVGVVALAVFIYRGWSKAIPSAK